MLYDENKLKIALDDVKLNFIHKEIEKIKNLKILELGVKNGISTRIHYTLPIHLQPAAKRFGYKIKLLSISENINKK